MRLVRMDRLRVEGVLNAKEYRPSEIQGPAGRGRRDARPRSDSETFPGKIVYVKPVVEGGEFQVRAEVQNRKQNGVWVLSPGMNAEMTIQLK